MIMHEVLIVGGGLAGLMAALTVSESAEVAVLSKVYPTRSHSGAAQGGFNAVLSENDRIESHIFDTVKGSDYLGDQDAIEVLCAEGPEVILELERMGVTWTRRADGGIAQLVIPAEPLDCRESRDPGPRTTSTTISSGSRIAAAQRPG